MIKSITGDIIDSKASCLVNTVNCEGFMGKGIAYQFKLRFPENEKYYSSICKKGEMHIGSVLLYEESNKIIANFPTKDKWREKSQYEYIEKGLKDLKSKIITEDIKSIAIPPLGCGNGGLDWDRVKALITQHLNDLNTEILLYEPSNDFRKQNLTVPKLTASHILLMRLKSRLTKFNKLRIQKSCFFINLFSGNDYFRFEEYKYGPYSHSIDILANQIKVFQTIYNVNTVDAEKIALNNLISDSVLATIKYYEIPILRASNFVNSIKKDHDLELVSTIIYIIKKNPDIDFENISELFFNWPKAEMSRFIKEELITTVEKLENIKILKKGLIGYSLNDEIIQVNSMPHLSEKT